MEKEVLKIRSGFSNIKPSYTSLEDFVVEYNDKGFSDICNSFSWQDIAYTTGSLIEKVFSHWKKLYNLVFFDLQKDTIEFEPNSFVHPSLLLNGYLQPANNIFEILAQTFDDSPNPFKDDRFNQYLVGFREFDFIFFLKKILSAKWLKVARLKK